MEKSQLMTAEQQFFKEEKKNFFSAIKWSTFESVLYQFLFISHQVGLFWYCDRVLYGQVGSIFSTAYLSVTMLLLGFEGSLIPFFQSITATKQSFKTFIIRYCLMQVIGIVLVSVLSGLLLSYVHCIPWSPTTLIVIGLFIIVETVKKMIKYLLYLAYYNRTTAFLEIGQIAVYVTTVWTAHFYYKVPFSINLFFIPLCLFSSLFCCYGIKLLYGYYNSLSLSAKVADQLNVKAFLSTRLSIFINQLCRVLFSTNVLIPLFAVHGGFAQAGIMTFANYLTHAASFFIYKICVPPAEGFFGRIKNTSASIHHQALRLLLVLFMVVATVLTLILLLNKSTLVSAFNFSEPTSISSVLLLFFFCIHLLENLFIVYEKIFLLEDSIWLLTVGNSLTCLLCFILLWFKLPLFSLIVGCIFVRLGLLFGLTYLLFLRSKG